MLIPNEYEIVAKKSYCEAFLNEGQETFLSYSVSLSYIMEMVASLPFLIHRKKGEDGLDEYKVLSSMGKGTFSILIFLLQALL